MDQAISKLLFIAASIAIAAVVTAVAWGAVSDNTPSDNDGLDLSQIRSQELCGAVGHTWTTASAPTCVTKG